VVDDIEEVVAVVVNAFTVVVTDVVEDISKLIAVGV
jgi:hypothetical protein